MIGREEEAEEEHFGGQCKLLRKRFKGWELGKVESVCSEWQEEIVGLASKLQQLKQRNRPAAVM